MIPAEVPGHAMPNKSADFLLTHTFYSTRVSRRLKTTKRYFDLKCSTGTQ